MTEYFGGLTERLRSLIGNQVRCNSPVGSSPMSSATENLETQLFQGFFILICNTHVTF